MIGVIRKVVIGVVVVFMVVVVLNIWFCWVKGMIFWIMVCFVVLMGGISVM